MHKIHKNGERKIKDIVLLDRTFHLFRRIGQLSQDPNADDLTFL